jgi:hypothetical protein
MAGRMTDDMATRAMIVICSFGIMWIKRDVRYGGADKIPESAIVVVDFFDKKMHVRSDDMSICPNGIE